MIDKQIYIIRDGISKYSIVLSAKASEAEEYAVQELRKYLLKVSHLELPIIEEKDELRHCIYVGHTAFAKRNNVVCNNQEHWKIEVCGEDVIITGGTSGDGRGTLYGVYHFLEDCVGIRWWNDVEEFIPEEKELKLNAGLKMQGTPCFRYRKVVGSYANVDFYSAARNRMNVVGSGDNVIEGAYSPSVKKTGGAYYAGPPGHVHTLELYFPVAEYFPRYSEWWGWDEAEQRRRSDRQFCLCNESFYAATEKKLLYNIKTELKKAERYGIEPPHFFSVSVADDQLHCQCPKCIESVKRSGRSGHYLKFINRLARKAAEEYPGATIETLAYWDYFEPPLDDIVPETNVIIRFADMLVDVAHDIKYPTNKRKLEVMKKWAEIGKKADITLYTWEYLFHNFPNFPMPVMYQFPTNYRMYYELGFKGCFVENELGAISDFWCCNQWMLHKYLENPYLDFEKTLGDFLTKYYGAAAEAIRTYLDMANELCRQSGMRVLLAQTCSNWNYITPQFVQKGLTLFGEAFEAVKGNAVFEQRVREASLALYRVIAIKQDDLIRSMKLHHLQFPLPTAYEASVKVLECLKEIREKYAFRMGVTSVHEDQFLLRHIQNETELFSRLMNAREEMSSVPEMLGEVEAEDIYSISAYKIVRYFSTQDNVVEENDEESDSGIVLRYRASALDFTDALVDVSQWRLSIVLARDGQAQRAMQISKEQLEGGGYRWFSLLNISEINLTSNSCLYVRNVEGLSIQLSPIQEFFPHSPDGCLKMPDKCCK